LRVIVLTPGVGGLGGISRMMDNVSEELALRREPDIDVRFVSTRGDVPLLKPFIFARGLLRVGMACAAGRCDVLHINLASSGSTARKLIFSAIADVCRTPYVIHLHGAEYREFWASRGNLGARAIERFFRRAAGILVLGRIWQDFVSERVPDAAGKIRILPNATRAPLVPHGKSKDREVVISFLGRLGPRKGTPQLVAALAALPDSGWRAVLAGDGDVADTRAMVRNLKLEHRVNVPGWVGPAKVEQILQETDVFVLPSFAENLPMSIIEAFAHGIAVVSTPVGSVPEMIEEGRTGLMVPVDDSAALASALQRLILDPELRMTLGRNARQAHDDHYRLSSYTDRLVALWQAAATPYSAA
jgi:glycosyltransferase involved in cell wall biosynthesis